MSVMEMAEHPNNVQLPPPVKNQLPTKLEQLLPIRKNQTVPKEFRTSNSVEAVQGRNENTSFLKCTNGSHLASFCLSCRRSFSQPTDFKQHQNNGCTNSNELKFLVSFLRKTSLINRVQVQNFHQFPSAGVELPNGETVDSLITMLCCNCSRVDFRDSQTFHEHILHCA